MKFNLFKQIALYVGILVLVVCAGLGIASYKFSSDSTINEAEETLLLLAKEGVRSIEAEIRAIYVYWKPWLITVPLERWWEDQFPVLKQEFERLEAEKGYLGMVSFFLMV